MTLDADSRKKQKKKKDKVRSAWISFAGRIVAQIVGSLATVALGVAVLHKHVAPEPKAASAAPVRAGTAQSAPPATEVVIAVLPLESGAEGSDCTMPDGWTTTTTGRRVRLTAQLVDAADEPLPGSRKTHGAGREARAPRESPTLPAEDSEAVTAR